MEQKLFSSAFWRNLWRIGIISLNAWQSEPGKPPVRLLLLDGGWFVSGKKRVHLSCRIYWHQLGYIIFPLMSFNSCGAHNTATPFTPDTGHLFLLSLASKKHCWSWGFVHFIALFEEPAFLQDFCFLLFHSFPLWILPFSFSCLHGFDLLIFF